MLKSILENKARLLKVAVLAVISLLYLGRSFNDFEEPFIKGDGFEYIMMTESFRNHYSPDLRLSDLQSFKQRFEKYHSWKDLFGSEVFDRNIEYFQKTKAENKENSNMGFHCNANQKWYCQHFFFYSLVNLPAYVICKHYGPLRSFYITNALLVIITCLILLFFTPFTLFNQILSALCFCFSACYWYLGWQHTEIYTMCLVTVSLVALFSKKHYLAVFLLALACLQNQPLTLLLGLYALITIKALGFTVKNMAKTGAITAIALTPPVFYLINYGTTNLIKDAGFLDTKYITVNRVAGFYTDFSQGMILTIPLILLLYIPLIIIEAQKMYKKEKPFDLSIFIPLVILFISITVSTMGNWNHGMAIINRYATWLSAIVMMHAFYIINGFSYVTSLVLFNYFFVTQCFTTLYHEQFNKFDWSSAYHTPLSKWLLRNHERLYNPDPVIFAGRIQPAVPLLEENSPIIYFHKRQVKKIMVHRNKVNDLVNFGLSATDLEDVKKKIKYNYDWGYIHMDDFKTSMKGEEIYIMLRKRKLQAIYDKIHTSSTWMSQLEEKAKMWGKTFEEACWIDAEYIVSMEEQKEDKE
jgi:hypothetical protein